MRTTHKAPLLPLVSPPSCTAAVSPNAVPAAVLGLPLRAAMAARAPLLRAAFAALLTVLPGVELVTCTRRSTGSEGKAHVVLVVALEHHDLPHLLEEATGACAVVVACPPDNLALVAAAEDAGIAVIVGLYEDASTLLRALRAAVARQSFRCLTPSVLASPPLGRDVPPKRQYRETTRETTPVLLGITLPGQPLTCREHEVARLIAVGLSNQEIADRLYISVPTVKGHVGEILGKLGLRRRTQVTAVLVAAQSHGQTVTKKTLPK